MFCISFKKKERDPHRKKNETKLCTKTRADSLSKPIIIQDVAVDRHLPKALPVTVTLPKALPVIITLPKALPVTVTLPKALPVTVTLPKALPLG
ncbi:MAG: hypothetical protein LBN93_08385 [Candidatus Symbiothrix sp.]|nr:hypothetical protein [Candidatus Symbiothrix sp.]